MPTKSLAYKDAETRRDQLEQYGQRLRMRIDAGTAVNVLNGLIRGEIEDIDPHRFKALVVALNKCVPDIKAVEISVQDQRTPSKAEIDGMLIEAGLAPLLETEVLEHDAPLHSSASSDGPDESSTIEDEQNDGQPGKK